MAIATDFPVIETGDNEAEFESWRLKGFQDEFVDRGRLYVSSDATTISLYRDVFRQPADLVAQGTGGANTVVQVTEANGSGISGTVKRRSATGTSTVTLYLTLCGAQDLREFDDRAESMLIEGELDFSVPLREMQRQFLIQFASEYPAPPGVSAPLRFVGDQVEEGRLGKPEWTAQYFWSLSGIGDWELTGLQNAKDYRSWAIYKTLEIVYDRKARAGDAQDPVFSRARFYQQKAMDLWHVTRPWVDIDHDGLPDRQPKIRTPKLRRG